MAGTVRVTSEGAYVEQGGVSVRVTSLGAYVEHGPPARVYVTSLGAYVEYENPYAPPVVPVYRSRLWRTYNGGHSWRLMPDRLSIMPATAQLNALAASGANLVIAGGLATDATHGAIIQAQD